MTNVSSLPVRHIRRDDAELAQIAVRKVISGWGPGDDRRRAGRLEGVNTLAGLAVVTLDSRTLITATNHVVTIPCKTCEIGGRRQYHSHASMPRGRR